LVPDLGSVRAVEEDCDVRHVQGAPGSQQMRRFPVMLSSMVFLLSYALTWTAYMMRPLIARAPAEPEVSSLLRCKDLPVVHVDTPAWLRGHYHHEVTGGRT
jgi:hypothetical protein